MSTAVESKDDARLIYQLFAVAASKGLCSTASFEEGLTPVVEIIDDIAIDAPKAFQSLEMMVIDGQRALRHLQNIGHYAAEIATRCSSHARLNNTNSAVAAEVGYGAEELP